MIQIFTAKNLISFQSYMADEEVQRLSNVRNQGLRKMTVSFGSEISASEILSKSTDGALRGIALVKFKENLDHTAMLEFNRLGENSGLFSKYGIHAEAFVKVMKSMPAIGALDYKQPDLIALFGVDDASKMKAYLSDRQYLELAPIRDNTLDSYHFFMCK
ncbi:hypothetical protein [Pseudochryseolinea flava]|uniref:DUF1330 domain-containing protein n=1 Tax=Pseudochryseolinea flava TaxID=2059302 RepID=A0A364Y3Y7_9BACT|nr:hypothetical protein [Pseudochryseolinea flava]RAW01533.1 hypothetical protein DQQ10_07690 [Pseudochryseolinea flava]